MNKIKWLTPVLLLAKHYHYKFTAIKAAPSAYIENDGPALRAISQLLRDAERLLVSSPS